MKILVNRPSIKNIIKGDRLSGIAVIAPLVAWLIFLLCLSYPSLPLAIRAVMPFTIYGAPYYFILAAAATVLSIAIIIGRVLHFRAVFRHGDVLGARVNYLIRRGNRLKIVYTYLFKRERYVHRRSIRINRYLENLEEGGTIAIILLQRKPGTSYIRDLFL